MREVAAFALEEATRLSPKESGRYAKSWFVMVDDREATVSEIRPGAIVVLVNDQPYSRKIHVGAHGFAKYGPPGIVEKVKELVKRRYGAIVTPRVDFIQLAGGYVLQGGRKGKAGRRRRLLAVPKNQRKGAPMTYPALRLTPKFG